MRAPRFIIRMISVLPKESFSLETVTDVYVTRKLPTEILAPIEERFEVRVWGSDDPVPREILRSEIAHVEGLLCMITETIDEPLIDAAPHLKVVSQMAVGVDNIDVAACEARDIAVGHTPGVLTETVADTAWALLGAVVRRIPEGERVVREGRWGPWSPFAMTGGEMFGTTLGIVGMGRIGQAVARRAVGFDMEVIYSSPRRKNVDAEWVPLDDLLERSDHVVVCAALNEETRGLIGRVELGRMKPSAYLVNVSRGPLVDTDALIDALDGGLISGAALDVTDPEPLPADHPLLDQPACLVVPHIGSSSVGTRMAMARMSVENLVAGLEGRPMPARISTY